MDRRALGLHWDLHPQRIFLNHGSFGLAPRELLQWRFQLLELIERDPVAFLVDQLPDRLIAARELLAGLIGASSDQLAFVPSTTYGLNELFQRLDQVGCALPQGSEILVSDHGYNATLNLIRYVAEQKGWIIRSVPLSTPLQDPAEVVSAFAAGWSDRTRLLLVDHITSPTALVLPLQSLIQMARERGALIIVDGAHGPGSLDLDLDAWCPDAYVGNLHKWLCCPRGSAFLWVKKPWQETLRPLVISHGANTPYCSGYSRFHQEHDWIGTADPTPWLALPEVARLFGVPDRSKLRSLMLRHSELAQRFQEIILAVFDQPQVAPAEMQSSMVALQLPPSTVLDGKRLQASLLRAGFQVPVIPLQPHQPSVSQFLRLSCFVYNTTADAKSLAEQLPETLEESLL